MPLPPLMHVKVILHLQPPIYDIWVGDAITKKLHGTFSVGNQVRNIFCVKHF